jgi:hypothetical protein
MLGLSHVEGLIRPLRRMVARRADVYWVQSSSLRTGVKEIVTRFGPLRPEIRIMRNRLRVCINLFPVYLIVSHYFCLFLLYLDIFH